MHMRAHAHTHTHLQEVLGEVREDGVESQVVEMSMVLSAVVVEVDKVLNVVVGPDVLDVLENQNVSKNESSNSQRRCETDTMRYTTWYLLSA